MDQNIEEREGVVGFSFKGEFYRGFNRVEAID